MWFCTDPQLSVCPCAPSSFFPFLPCRRWRLCVSDTFVPGFQPGSASKRHWWEGDRQVGGGKPGYFSSLIYPGWYIQQGCTPFLLTSALLGQAPGYSFCEMLWAAFRSLDYFTIPFSYLDFLSSWLPTRCMKFTLLKSLVWFSLSWLDSVRCGSLYHFCTGLKNQGGKVHPPPDEGPSAQRLCPSWYTEFLFLLWPRSLLQSCLQWTSVSEAST